MFLTKKQLPRRTFLRGMGTSLALPLLDAMVPALTAQAATAAKPVRRLGFVYMPMGAPMASWTPKGAGKLTELSPSLRPGHPPEAAAANLNPRTEAKVKTKASERA